MLGYLINHKEKILSALELLAFVCVAPELGRWVTGTTILGIVLAALLLPPIAFWSLAIPIANLLDTYSDKLFDVFGLAFAYFAVLVILGFNFGALIILVLVAKRFGLRILERLVSAAPKISRRLLAVGFFIAVLVRILAFALAYAD